MKLILLESIDGLGRPGDEVKVRPGYARNYLLPYRKAVPHTADALRMLGRLKKKAEEEERAMVASTGDLARKLEGFAITIQARANEERHLFGSVTEKDIHRALVGAGWTVPLRAVRLSGHLKEAGRHEIVLHLYGDITATIAVEVLPVDGEGTVIEAPAPAPEGEGEGEQGRERDERGEPPRKGRAREGKPTAADA